MSQKCSDRKVIYSLRYNGEDHDSSILEIQSESGAIVEVTTVGGVSRRNEAMLDDIAKCN